MTDKYSQMSPFLRALDRTTAPPDDGSAPIDHVIAAGIPGGYNTMNRAMSGIRGMAKSAYDDYEGMGGARGIAKSALNYLGYGQPTEGGQIPGEGLHDAKTGAFVPTLKAIPGKVPHYDPKTGFKLINDSPLPEQSQSLGERISNYLMPEREPVDYGSPNITDVPKNVPPPAAMGVRGANGGRIGYAMGGSPFEQLGGDAPGLPTEDAADILQFIRKQNDQFGGSEGTRTYYGGAPARLGTPEGNAFYERQNDLKTPLKLSNFGRGDVTQFPPTEAERAIARMTPDRVRQIQDADDAAGRGPRTIGDWAKSNNVPVVPEAKLQDYTNLNKWLSDPDQQDKFNSAWSTMTIDEKTRFMRLFPHHFWGKASGGPVGYAFGGSPFGAHPFNVERAASIGLQREGFLNSGVAGRTDHIGLQVRNGSYVIPADVVSAAGQGNSLAGAKAFDSLLKQGPYGTTANPIKSSRPMMPSMRMGNTMRMSNNMGRMNTSGFGSQKSTGIPGFMADGGTVKKPRELVAPKEGAWKGLSAGGVSHPGAEHSIPILAAGGEYVVSPEAVARVGGGDQQKGFRILDKLVLLTRKKHIDTLRKLKPPKKK